MMRPMIAGLCALLVSPGCQEPPISDSDDPAGLLARCLSEEELHSGRTVLWHDARDVYRSLVYFEANQCLDRIGNILAFDVEIIGKIAKGSAYIVEHCPIEKLRSPQTWYMFGLDLDQAVVDAAELREARKRLTEWEDLCDNIAGRHIFDFSR